MNNDIYKVYLIFPIVNEEMEKSVLSAPEAQKWLQGKPPKKIIIVPKKIVNIVV